MDDGLNAVRALLPGVPMRSVEPLGGSTRSRVQRISAGDDTLIVKEFVEAGEGWVRESAALSVLPADAPVPRVVAECAVPPTVVMSDAGPGASVADALLGEDTTAAADAVCAWAAAIGVLHRLTAGSRDAFREALGARFGDLPVSESRIPADLDDAARIIGRHCSDLGVDVPPGALEELTSLATRLGGEGSAALTPADACPDNNVASDDGLVLIDFEGAQWRHIAWDVAYLTVPWPSCWCSWRIPVEVSQRAIGAYLAASNMSDVDLTAFRLDVDAAAIGWAFISTSWFLPQALAGDAPSVNPSRLMPSRRAMILHRLDQARRSAEAAALAELSARLQHALTTRWGDVKLPYAPSFAQAAE